MVKFQAQECMEINQTIKGQSEHQNMPQQQLIILKIIMQGHPHYKLKHNSKEGIPIKRITKNKKC